MLVAGLAAVAATYDPARADVEVEAGRGDADVLAGSRTEAGMRN